MSKRKLRSQNKQEQASPFNLRTIAPLTPNQAKAFSAYERGSNVVLHGYAGTGKTFVSLYLGIEQVLSENSPYEKIVIVRSAVPSRDMGFMPGNLTEKSSLYEEPYVEICEDLLGRHDAYSLLKSKGKIQFVTTSFLRGTTFKNSIVLLDEVQNFSYPEAYTTLTRMGVNSRLIMCGDFRQTDLDRRESNNSMIHTCNIMKKIKNTEFIEFEKEDIVRSGFVKCFIIESTKYMDGLQNRV